MNWREHLGDVWRNMPVSLRRLTYGLLVAAAVMLALSFVLPPEQQLWAVVGLFALFVVVQGAILVQLGRQRPAVRQARRMFLQEDFEGVIQILEVDREAGQADVVSCTLLGNAYRQLGRLPESEAVLRDAVELDASSPFAAYGLGRTLLAKGQFSDAATWIAQAVAQGGQPVILIELALAQYYAGDTTASLQALLRAEQYHLEPSRMLMAVYLRWRLNELTEQEARTQLAAYSTGLAAWEAESIRFAATPFGGLLSDDVDAIGHLLVEA